MAEAAIAWVDSSTMAWVAEGACSPVLPPVQRLQQIHGAGQADM